MLSYVEALEIDLIPVSAAYTWNCMCQDDIPVSDERIPHETVIHMHVPDHTSNVQSALLHYSVSHPA